MPSRRKRIGYLPSEEVHEIIDKLCRANEFSQSKVTGLLVEEALRSRGALIASNPHKENDRSSFMHDFFEKKSSTNNKYLSNSDDYKVNKKVLSDDIKMMHEFIEFKYFKKAMNQNNNIME